MNKILINLVVIFLFFDSSKAISQEVPMWVTESEIDGYVSATGSVKPDENIELAYAQAICRLLGSVEMSLNAFNVESFSQTIIERPETVSVKTSEGTVHASCLNVLIQEDTQVSENKGFLFSELGYISIEAKGSKRQWFYNQTVSHDETDNHLFIIKEDSLPLHNALKVLDSAPFKLGPSQILQPSNTDSRYFINLKLDAESLKKQ